MSLPFGISPDIFFLGTVLLIMWAGAPIVKKLVGGKMPSLPALPGSLRIRAKPAVVTQVAVSELPDPYGVAQRIDVELTNAGTPPVERHAFVQAILADLLKRSETPPPALVKEAVA